MTLTIQNKTEVQPFTEEQIGVLKNTLCKGLTKDDFAVFLYACSRTGLDPFMRQIYPIPRQENVNGKWETKMTIQTGIDGYRLIAERTGKYAPGRAPGWAYDKDGNIHYSTAFVKKQTADGTWHEVSAVAFYSEYVQVKKDGSPTRFWQKMGHNQLAKCAEALALRKAFPAQLSGIYTQEEMQQASKEGEDLNTIQTVAVEEIKIDKEKQQQQDQLEIEQFTSQWSGDVILLAEFIADIQKKMPKKTTLDIVRMLKKNAAVTSQSYDNWFRLKEEAKTA